MKKLFIILIAALLLIGGGASYYVFFMQDPQETVSETPEPSPMMPKPKPKAPIIDLTPQIQDYYVIERRLTVISHPTNDALAVDTLYKGEQVTIFEQQDDTFGRISEYMVFSEGEEPAAEWIPLAGVSLTPPKIDEIERLEILDGYLHQSDDLKLYQDVFRETAQQLLDNGQCEPEDFSEMSGWIRSVTFKQEPVYFIYCGGLSRHNKIYLNAYNNEIFALAPDGRSKISLGKSR